MLCCRYVCYTVTDASSIIQKLTGSRELKELFNEEELSKLRSHLTVEPTAVTTAPAENGTWGGDDNIRNTEHLKGFRLKCNKCHF